uniref:Uncharacterized protein n=1 Tax=Arundo donax TaxID=35708 RepID=A0A0A9HPE3_ARUDO
MATVVSLLHSKMKLFMLIFTCYSIKSHSKTVNQDVPFLFWD